MEQTLLQDTTQLAGLLNERLRRVINWNCMELLAHLDPWRRHQQLPGCEDCPVKRRAQALYEHCITHAKDLRKWIPLLPGDCLLEHAEVGTRTRQAVCQLCEVALEHSNNSPQLADARAFFLERAKTLYGEADLGDAHLSIKALSVYHSRYHAGKESLDTALLDKLEHRVYKAISQAQREHDRQISERDLENARLRDAKRTQTMRKIRHEKRVDAFKHILLARKPLISSERFKQMRDADPVAFNTAFRQVNKIQL